MITFKEFLQEEYKSSLSEEEVKSLFETSCSDAWGNAKLRTNPILRGSNKWNDSFMIVQGENGQRRSAHGMNYYTLIFDAVLKDYPKRSKSIICGNFANKDHVEEYADGADGIYAIIPFNGVDIGVCPTSDIWETPLSNGMRTSMLNDIFSGLDITDSYVQGFITDLHLEVQKLKQGNTDHFTKPLTKLLKEIFTGTETVNEVKDILFDLYRGANMNKETTANCPLLNDKKPRECWIGGKCLAVKYEVYKTWL